MDAQRLKQLVLFGIFLLLAISMHHTHADSPDSPEGSEIKIRSHLADVTSNGTRVKRQYGCPPGCFSSCSNSQQCQRYQVATVCMLGCCCPQTNLSSACDGDAAVAACLNGLCGQGYFCNNRNFCCRCQSGTSPGPCVNNLCPAGFACNTNNYCCSLGSGSVLGPCINDHVICYKTGGIINSHTHFPRGYYNHNQRSMPGGLCMRCRKFVLSCQYRNRQEVTTCSDQSREAHF